MRFVHKISVLALLSSVIAHTQVPIELVLVGDSSCCDTSPSSDPELLPESRSTS